jgi:hypothetical protein
VDPHWVTGFSDAQASFTYSRSGKQLALYFAIKLPPNDRELLEDLQDFFGGVGRIYEVGSRSLYFRVSRRVDLARVVEHFDEYPLRSSKRTAYELWRQMVIAKQRFRRPERERLDDLAERLSTER